MKCPLCDVEIANHTTTFSEKGDCPCCWSSIGFRAQRDCGHAVPGMLMGRWAKCVDCNEEGFFSGYPIHFGCMKGMCNCGAPADEHGIATGKCSSGLLPNGTKHDCKCKGFTSKIPS